MIDNRALKGHHITETFQLQNKMSSSHLEHARREEELPDDSEPGEAEDSRSEKEDEDGGASHVVGYSQYNEQGAPVPKSKVTVRSAITLGVLVFINLLNYMDRFTVAGSYNV